ncbi:T9SS type A sorting domain-containing protein [candidate division WOR-3 bacterium]|nr:T9SS type A sorting domain-containing protein [candidate division WOR-3 bacterium]
MIVILALVSSITLQPFYYTNTNYYYQIMSKNGVVYGATNGGMISFDPVAHTYTVVNNTDGLQTNRQYCCAIDSSGYLWCGNERGLALVDRSFVRTLLYPDQVISSFVQVVECLTDSIYIGSPGGLLFIQTHGTPDNFDDDTRTRLYVQNGLLSNNVVSIALTSSHIWVGTDQGITRFVKSFDPDSLVQFTTVQGLLSNNILQIEVIRDTIYVASDQGLNVFNGSFFDTLLSNREIVDVSYLGDSIVVAMDTLQQVGFYYQATLTIVQSGLPYKSRVLDVENFDGELYCGLGNRWTADRTGMGLGHFLPNETRWDVEARECLPSNHITEIEANQYGVFCAHGARTAYSRGIGWLHDDGRWDSFTRDSILPSNNIHRCVIAPDGKMWFAVNPFSSSGSDTIMLIRFDVANDEWLFIPRGFCNIDTTVAVWDIEFDNENNLYVALSGPSDRLWVIDRELENAMFLGLKREGFNVEIAIDSAGVVWRTVSGSDGGLLMVDTRGTVFDHNDDIVREFNTGDGLISKYLFGCIIADERVLYVANDTGLVVYENSGFRSYTDIANQEYFDVEVDTEGRIWIMTRTGLYYYDPILEVIQGWEYYELGVHIQFMEFSNEVIQIQGFEFDPERSCFWLGGETGLLQLMVVQDSIGDLDSILIYPNPAVASPVVKIKNLPADAHVRIFSITGRMLAEDLIPDDVFREVVWTIPEDVASGLYFAVVTTSHGSRVCKFAIVK